MPIQQEMHDIQDSIEQAALELYKNDPELAKKLGIEVRLKNVHIKIKKWRCNHDTNQQC